MAPKRRVASSTASPASGAAPATSTQTTSSSTPITLSAKASPQEIVLGIWQRYISQTPQRILLLDTFMGFLVAVAALQFVYCVLAGNYPFNAFLSGFSAAIGQIVLTVSLRMQTSDQAKASSKENAAGDQASSGISSERAFADYIFGSVILHFFCINFIN